MADEELSEIMDDLESSRCDVKNQETIKVLGSISCLLTNKTGVITQDRMTVSNFWMDNQIVDADYDYDQNISDLPYTKTPGWKMLSRVASLCNSAEFKDRSSRERIMRRETIGGNATDDAILKCCELNMGNVMEFKDRNKMVAEIPFNSYNKYQVTIHETEDANDERYLVAMKGAPEIIWEKCSTILVDGEDKPITQEWKEAFQKAISEQAGKGFRVIGFCDVMLPAAKYPPGFSFDPDNIDIPLQDMRFVGMMSIIDPPKAAAPDSITCLRQRYGVKVIMITGDHPVTSMAIALSVGLVSMNAKTNIRCGAYVKYVEDTKDAEALVITGEQLRELSQSKLVEMMENCGEIVFARISPDQRISIVEACRSLGLRVAVTGSKKDDIPSLKMGDVGIVMGIGGDQEAKEAADMVLLDNNFGTIANALGLGKHFVASFPQEVQE